MAEAPHFPAIWPPLREELHREGALGALADRQHGVVAMSQLRELGLSGRAVRDRVASGRLPRIHRGAYAVGRLGLTKEGWRMAAVLASGSGAVLSHRAAAAHRGLRPDNRARVE